MLVARTARGALRLVKEKGLVFASEYEDLSRKYDSEGEDLTSQIASLLTEAGFPAREA